MVETLRAVILFPLFSSSFFSLRTEEAWADSRNVWTIFTGARLVLHSLFHLMLAIE